MLHLPEAAVYHCERLIDHIDTVLSFGHHSPSGSWLVVTLLVPTHRPLVRMYEFPRSLFLLCRGWALIEAL